MTVNTASGELSDRIGAVERDTRAARFALPFEDLRHTILESTPAEIAKRSGAVWDDCAGVLLLDLLGQRHRLTWPALDVYRAGCDRPVSSHVTGIFLYYLSLADGATRSGKWISFRELPDGWLYHAAFQGYSGKVLASALQDDATTLERAAASLGGLSLHLGDVGYAFAALPNVHLAVVYWFGDDEFDADAQVLFDASASHYMTTDGLAILGSHLVHRLLDQL